MVKTLCQAWRNGSPQTIGRSAYGNEKTSEKTFRGEKSKPARRGCRGEGHGSSQHKRGQRGFPDLSGRFKKILEGRGGEKSKGEKGVRLRRQKTSKRNGA